MMHLVDPQIEIYLERLVPPRPEPFKTMEAYALDKGFPIIGPLCGRVLTQLARMTGAKRILELGSGFGYSACWFALGMAEGEIICTDGDAANRDRALGYFPQINRPVRIDFRVGDAVEIIRTLDGPFDIIFNDIDKHQYPDTVDLAVERLRPGGVFVTDNALWSGRILEPKGDRMTEGVREFTRRIYAHPQLVSSILPLRDGLAVAVKT